MPDLEIFVSWSQTASRKAAEFLKQWLPKVLPGAKPWMSKIDITKGKPWFSSISEQLPRSQVCIICVTPENVESPWLYYEAGAIAHARDEALICAYLLAVEPRELAGTPLGQYQATTFEKDDTWRMIQSINALLESPHSENLLRGNFDGRWPALQKKFAMILEHLAKQKPGEAATSVEDEAAALGAEAKHILMEAARDSRGSVHMGKTNFGFSLQTNGQVLCDRDDPRIEAAYRSAMNDLVSRGVLEPRGSKGETFTLTKQGYDLADLLSRAARNQTPAALAPAYDDNDILALLQGWLGARSTEQNLAPIQFAQVDKDLNLPPGSAKRLLEQAAQKYHYLADVRGENVITFKEGNRQLNAPFVFNPKGPW